MDVEQKYTKDGHRLVAGCIPIRKEKNSNAVKILMVKSQNGRNIVFPKGGWETHDKSAEEAAIREAQEEAGVQGQVLKALGVYTFEKAKRQRNPEGVCEVHMFVLEVTEELDTWPEQHRERVWIDLDKIRETILIRCRHKWMREALDEYMAMEQQPQVDSITSVWAEKKPKQQQPQQQQQACDQWTERDQCHFIQCSRCCRNLNNLNNLSKHQQSQLVCKDGF